MSFLIYKMGILLVTDPRGLLSGISEIRHMKNFLIWSSIMAE